MRGRSVRVKIFAATLMLGPVLAWIVPSFADESATEVRVSNGRFEPPTLTIGANTPTRIKVVNSGTAPIEFESFELNRERIVPAGQSVTVFIPSLSPGTYHFFDDFHRDTQGTLIAQ